LKITFPLAHWHCVVVIPSDRVATIMEAQTEKRKDFLAQLAQVEQERDYLGKQLHQCQMKLMSLGIVPDGAASPGQISVVPTSRSRVHATGFYEIPVTPAETKVKELTVALQEAVHRNTALREKLKIARELRHLNPACTSCHVCNPSMASSPHANPSGAGYSPSGHTSYEAPHTLDE
jgi:hypothetical protein